MPPDPLHPQPNDSSNRRNRNGYNLPILRLGQLHLQAGIPRQCHGATSRLQLATISVVNLITNPCHQTDQPPSPGSGTFGSNPPNTRILDYASFRTFLLSTPDMCVQAFTEEPALLELESRLCGVSVGRCLSPTRGRSYDMGVRHFVTLRWVLC